VGGGAGRGLARRSMGRVKPARARVVRVACFQGTWDRVRAIVGTL
jgi:hypothetical protein